MAENFDTKFLTYLREIATTISKAAGAHVLKLRDEGFSIDSKGENDFVTQADTEAEAMVVGMIQELSGDDSIVGEEGANIKGSSDLTWYVDPIDGTMNFIEGGPFGVSIAVASGDQLLAAAIYLPAEDRLYSAALGLGATRNGKQISVKQGSVSLSKSIVVTGQPYAKSKVEDRVHLELAKRTMGVRVSGAAVVNFTYVAEGYCNGYAQRGLKKWDVAAGMLIAQEAGAATTTPFTNDWQSREDEPAQDLVIGHPDVVEELAEFWTNVRIGPRMKQAKMGKKTKTAPPTSQRLNPIDPTRTTFGL